MEAKLLKPNVMPMEYLPQTLDSDRVTNFKSNLNVIVLPNKTTADKLIIYDFAHAQNS